MSVAVLWAWLMANEAAIATILLVISELLGANPKVKSNGIVSFILLQLKNQAEKRGGVDPTP
jgi:hypothetical protein